MRTTSKVLTHTKTLASITACTGVSFLELGEIVGNIEIVETVLCGIGNQIVHCSSRFGISLCLVSKNVRKMHATVAPLTYSQSDGRDGTGIK